MPVSGSIFVPRPCGLAVFPPILILMKNTDTAPSGADSELVARLVATYGLENALAERVVEDMLVAFGPTLEEWVRSRHIRLQRQGLKNEEIYRLIAEEIPARRFASEPLSSRQIRRLIYG